MNSFSKLSPEAAMLFIIGEPIRRVDGLTFDQWTHRTFQLWEECTGLDFEQFRKAFGEVGDWLKSKSKGRK